MLRFLLNILWFVLGGIVMGLGWWLALGHLTSAVACFVSIIGIPFGIQHFKQTMIAQGLIAMKVVPVRK
jgi:uncharacterized membrane protein YccF (DUF307 family)